MKEKNLVKGEILFDEGSADETLYILISGKLEVLKMAGSENSITIDTVKQGAMPG